MIFIEYIFWVSCFIIFYNYAGYAIVAYLLTRLQKRRKKNESTAFLPSISFIVAAYNEEDCIEKKILNSFEQNYPSEKIEYIFITDGSTDNTPAIIKAFPSIRLLHDAARQGKSSALNKAVHEAQNEILVFSDANTVLNRDACKYIALHYNDPEVGGVAGEKKVLSGNIESDGIGSSEGLYWKYESFLKKIDSEFYSVVGAAGELFSLRKDLYENVEPQVILDDFIISMKVAKKGYRVIYEPKAYAMELPSFSIQDERKRKVRIAAGGFQAMGMLPEILHFWKHFKLSFLYISHRVLRWTLSPLCLVLAFLSCFWLSLFSGNILYKLGMGAQTVFYLSGLFAYTFPLLSKKFKIIKLPYYFIFMNISVIQGFFRFLGRKQSSVWEKVKRSNSGLLEAK